MISHNIRKYGPPPAVARGPYRPVGLTEASVSAHNKAAGINPGDIVMYKTRGTPPEIWADVSLVLHNLHLKDCFRSGNRIETIRIIALGSYQQNGGIAQAWARTDDPNYLRKAPPHEIEMLEKKTGVSFDQVRRDCVAEAARRGFAYNGPSLDSASAAS